MMRLKVEKVGEGLHPSELVVSVQTKDGPVLMIVDPGLISPDGTVNIGWPVGKKNDYFLVELPRETVQGAGRVWVAANELTQAQEKKRARA
jgi:hypothetical protein